MLDTITVFWAKYGSDLLKGTWDTLVMTGISTIFAYLIGLPLGVILTITQPNGIRPNRAVNQILGIMGLASAGLLGALSGLFAV